MNADAGSDGLRADLVCNALMIEYQNIHQRVLDQIELYETTNTRILTLIGVLFYFGLTNFSNMSDAYTHVIVNLVLRRHTVYRDRSWLLPQHLVRS